MLGIWLKEQYTAESLDKMHGQQVNLNVLMFLSCDIAKPNIIATLYFFNLNEFSGKDILMMVDEPRKL